MNEQLNALIEKYKISEEYTRKIFERFIRPELKQFTPLDAPTGVIVGAQPGAGKSQILNLLKTEFQNNIVICNADDYRKFHPETEEILFLHEPYFPDITTGLAQNLNLMLRNECKSRGFNFALEITLGDGAGANATIQGIKNSGFICHLDIMAVNEKWSRLGIVERLEAQRAIEKYGQVVSTEVHDERYHAMPNALMEVTTKKLFDQLRVFNRKTQMFNGRLQQELGLIAINPAHPIEVLLKERNRPFTLDEIRHFKNEVVRIENFIKMRNGTQQEIAAFKQAFLPGAFLKKGKIKW